MSYCKSCGCCCGPVPISGKDRTKIKRFIKFKNIIANPEPGIKCKFLDKNNKCMIYLVRPEVCVKFGAYENLKCENYKGAIKPFIRPKKVNGLTMLNDI